MPAMWWAGSASSHRPGPPRRECVADALAVSAAVVNIAPLGMPVVPDVDTTKPTSSSMPEPTRKASVSKFFSRASKAGTGSSAASPASIASRAGKTRRTSGPAGTSRARRVAIGVLAVSWIVQRPALRGQSLPHPLDVLRGRQVVGDLRDRHPDVHVVEVAPSHELVRDSLHLVRAQPPRQQGEDRDVIGPRNPFGVPGAQPVDDRSQEPAHTPHPRVENPKWSLTCRAWLRGCTTRCGGR